MFGWGSTGLNMHFGGLTGKSFAKSIDNEYWPPYHGESLGPGMMQFHLSKFRDPSAFSMGLATNPKGWSLLQSFLYFLSLLMTSSLTYFFMRQRKKFLEYKFGSNQFKGPTWMKKFIFKSICFRMKNKFWCKNMKKWKNEEKKAIEMNWQVKDIHQRI